MFFVFTYSFKDMFFASWGGSRLFDRFTVNVVPQLPSKFGMLGR